ncbi:hypothetical protein LB566_24580 [Mesorhizobium sp. CA13]|uniref:hypothetical protein n=1 Tax=unclassified Mesorhizobium TaxID=325217 RepID=UPI00112EC3E7|nr:MULTISPECIES: hypothetical protein [unclassified Mesorhizobium]MBZ9810343.1 hypothetical protein [Mesorhizobium sp. ESP-6-2]MBZ9856974.1 hypothetical protein [Mesorhizobium sp. CA13]MBZ9872212.1 hypothetical protein [Mesorhizobium sp. BR1-1-9]MBZ9943092.1 hypothetical protein [Mesorhizobium sp. BR1-1-13]MBZ9966522.1 hypothetical protein [Mesorhizobium sp. BR1-1-2]
MMKTIFVASALSLALATSALAQTSGSGNAGGTAGGGMNNSGTSVNGSGNTTGTVTTDPNATNSTTTTPNGMNDRCKDTAGNDVDTNTASGTATSPSQNCNK